MNIVRLTGAEVAYGDRRLLDGANFSLQSGEKVALLGRNGVGKSTLLKVLAGEIGLDDGNLWQADITVSSLAQEVPELTGDTVYHAVVAGLGELGSFLDQYHHISQNPSPDQLDELAALEAGIESLGGWNVDQRVTRVLDTMGLTGDLRMSDCSGGQRRRAMLARALVAEPDLLLLDEPTNHLDIPAIDALQSLMESTRATVVFVSHDRALIERVATRIVEVDRGALINHECDYVTFLDRKQKAEEEEATTNRKFDQRLAQEEVWIRQGIKARRTRNEGRVRKLEALRRARAARINKSGTAGLTIESGQQSGNLVMELENVSFAYDKPVIENFSTKIMRGDRVGIIGANGSGKSTLLRLLLGEIEPQSGTLRRGTKLQTAYFDQQRAQLDETASLRDNVGEGSDTIEVGGKSKHVVGYLNDFLFPSSQLNMPVASLSGGEKNRLLLAKLLAKSTNLLVLDEPTNDLDVETLELLEEMLGDYAGTLLLVSHDRAFLDAVVTSTIAFEAGGVHEYVGGYTDWVRQSKKNSRTAAPTPTPESSKAHIAERKNRLSYKDKRELEALPATIEALEEEQTTLQAEVAKPEFYQKDGDFVRERLDRLTALSETIEQAYERWQTLSESDTG